MKTLSISGFGEVKKTYKQTLDTYRLHAPNAPIVFLFHTKEVTKGDENVLRPVAQGSTKEDIFALADQIGLAYKNEDGYFINFGQNAQHWTKDTAQLGHIKVPPIDKQRGFLKFIIDKTWDGLRARAAATQQAENMFSALKDAVQACNGAEDWTNLAKQLRDAEAPALHKKHLMSEAQASGLTWDTETNGFKAADNQSI